MNPGKDLLYQEESYTIRGAVFDVYREIGCGFFGGSISGVSGKGIPFIELKAVKTINDQHRAQVHNYLKASGKKLGMLINFGHHPKAEIERIIK